MEEIKVGIIGHGFMGHEHESMLTNMELLVKGLIF